MIFMMFERVLLERLGNVGKERSKKLFRVSRSSSWY